MSNNDPTREEILGYLEECGYQLDEDNLLDIEEAIYWFCATHHSGQWSNLYSIVSTSKYRPSPLHNGPSTEMSKEIYKILVWKYSSSTEDL